MIFQPNAARERGRESAWGSELQIPLIEMVSALSDAMDLISPRLVDHHKRVAYIATSIADEMGLPQDRPYRKGMSGEEARQVLLEMVKSGALDATAVSVVYAHWDEVNSIRTDAQSKTALAYESFRRR